MKAVLGIDLGQTTAKVSVSRDGNVQLIPLFGTFGIIPSSFVLNKEGEVVIGPEVEFLRLKDPDSYFPSLRNLLQNSVECIRIHQNEFLISELASRYFMALKAEIELCLETKARFITLTVPGYFSERERTKLVGAAKSAGFHLLGVLSEPVAALLSLLDKTGTDDSFGTYLIYDLGGGSLDVAIVSVRDTVDILATSGDRHFGGQDLTLMIVEMLNQQIEHSSGHNIAIEGNERQKMELLGKAEFAKQELSYKEEIDIHLNLPGENIFKKRFTRDELKDLFSSRIDQSLEIVNNAVQDSGLVRSDIDACLLIGGSSKIPSIKNAFRHQGFPLIEVEEPQCEVCTGAAIYGDSILEKYLYAPGKETLGSPSENFTKKLAHIRESILFNKEAFNNSNEMLENLNSLERSASAAYANNNTEEIAKIDRQIHQISDYVDKNINEVFNGENTKWRIFVPIYANHASSELRNLMSVCADQIQINQSYKLIQGLNSIPNEFHSDEEASRYLELLHRANEHINQIRKNILKEQSPELDKTSDQVDCTVYSPPEIRCGESMLVQIFAHLIDKRSEAEQMAKEFDEDAVRRGFTSLNTNIERGSQLSFELSFRDILLDDPTQTLIWNGRTESVEFEVNIPRDLTAEYLIGKVIVSKQSIPLGHIRFKIKVIDIQNSVNELDRILPTGTAKKYEKAFISYASQDRSEVLRRVQMLSAAHIKYFQDVLTLEPGDRWEQQIYRYIKDADVFFLFWSTAASNSEWVLKEIRYALERKSGMDHNPPEIVPIPIENPPPLPPEELKHIHFNDQIVYFIDSSSNN